MLGEKTTIDFNGFCNYLPVTLVPPFVKTDACGCQSEALAGSRFPMCEEHWITYLGVQTHISFLERRKKRRIKSKARQSGLAERTINACSGIVIIDIRCADW